MTSNPSFPSPFEDVSPATSSDSGEFTIGVDLGQSFDPTAVAVVRKLDAGGSHPVFQIGHLQRLPLQTSYPAVVNHVGRLISHLRGPAELVVDYTGVGRPVFDMFQIAGMSPIGVSITAGDVVTNEGLVYRVPKLMLISRVQALLHSGQLKIHRGLADAPALVEELQSFRAQVTDQGFWRFGARSGRHDDLVLAVAIALWRSHGDTMQSRGIFEYYRQQYGSGAERAPEPQAAEPLPEPLPADPFRFYDIGAGGPAPADVVLRAPSMVSSATGLSGRSYLPDAAGNFRIAEGDVRPFVGAGWTRV
jgi:hypothetical protein